MPEEYKIVMYPYINSIIRSYLFTISAFTNIPFLISIIPPFFLYYILRTEYTVSDQ